MPAFHRLCIVVNRSKPGAETMAHLLKSAALEIGVDVSIVGDYPILDGTLKGFDLCCVIGGDGSLLSVATDAFQNRVPVMGINLGKLGFMATSSGEQGERKLIEILEGRSKRSERSMLECRSCAGNGFLALNDIVFKSAEGNRLIELEVFAGDRLVTRYNSDGLVLSTPTGSTAYNLSAGGPLIDSEAEIIAMTPICPHTLSNRSVVFGADTNLKVCLANGGKAPLVTVDGRALMNSEELFPISVGLRSEKLTLIHSLDYGPFDVVRNKLGWDY